MPRYAARMAALPLANGSPSSVAKHQGYDFGLPSSER